MKKAVGPEWYQVAAGINQHNSDQATSWDDLYRKLAPESNGITLNWHYAAARIIQWFDDKMQQETLDRYDEDHACHICEASPGDCEATLRSTNLQRACCSRCQSIDTHGMSIDDWREWRERNPERSAFR
jgi:poly-D-alanine transfer protein DltD